MSDLVPSQATTAPQSFDNYAPATSQQLTVPEGLPPDTAMMVREIVKKPPCRNPELKRLQRLHDGGPSIINDENDFPRPDAMTVGEWEACKRQAVYVNLVKPATRRLVSGVYSKVVRTVEPGSPFKDELDELLGPGSTYSQDSRCWFENATLFGTAVRVWTVGDNDELESWLPNPIFTHICEDPANLKNVRGVFEYSPTGDMLRFVTAEGHGNLRPGGKLQWKESDFGFVPFTVGYGHDRTHRGECYGLSLVREAPDYSVRVTQVMLYLAILQKIYSRAQAVIEGATQMENPQEAFGVHGVLELQAGSKFYYASPDAKFKETLDIVRQYISILAIILSIPQDAFDASAIEPNQSAESAKMRNIPLSSLTNFLIEEWRRNEIDFARRGAAMMQFIRTKRKTVTFADIRKFTKVSVTMEAASVPESKTEEVANWLALLKAAVKTPEDTARHFNPDKSEKEVMRIAESVAEQLAADLAPEPMPIAAPATAPA